ncbi:MFS transporter [Microbulbifer sp. JMSA004]|uniref:MFS transporter n=1 Tax=Microbulbifer sp. JMSA004 TaxID=3243370 RepID=UPI00403A1A48
MERQELIRLYGFQMGWGFFSTYLVLPILTPFFLAMGLSMPQLGIILAIMGLSVMLFELPTGSLADQIGRKKVYLISLTMSMACYLVLLVWQSFYGALLAMFLWGASQALFSGSLNAWFVECFNQAEGTMSLQEGFSHIATRAGLIGALGAMSCALVVGGGEYFGHYDLDLYRGLLALSLFSSLLLFAFTEIKIRENRVFDRFRLSNIGQIPSQLSLGIKACYSPSLWRLLLAVILLTPIASAVEKYWPVRLEALSGDMPVGWLYGLLMALIMLLGSLSAKITTWMAQFFNQQLGKVLLVASLIKLSLVMLLALSGDLLLFVSLFLLFNFSIGLGLSASAQLQHQAVKDEVRSTVDSIFSLTTRFGGVIGSLVCGFGAAEIGLNNTWLLLAAMGLCGSCIFLSSEFNPTIIDRDKQIIENG